MKIKAVILGLAVSGLLSLCSATQQAENIIDPTNYEAILENTDLDLTKKENAKAVMISIMQTASVLKEIGKEIVANKIKIRDLQKEIVQLKQQWHSCRRNSKKAPRSTPITKKN